MHYYPHNIGDFDKATRHLTRVERSVYRDLLDLYYDTEKPLPLDTVWICRRIIATSNDEATAVEQVLNEFFIKTPDSWFHVRCDAEIIDFKNNQSQKSAAGKASAAARQARKQQALNGCLTDVEQASHGDSTKQNQEPETEPETDIKEPKGSLSTSLPPCPHETLINNFVEHCPTLPQPRIELWKTGKNGKAMRDRWHWVLTSKNSKGEPYATNADEAIAWFSRYFRYVAKSDFLMGIGSDWNADLGWLVNRTNFEKVLQGNYENKDKS